MNKSRHELKVGLFVLVGLVLIGLLMLQFSKGIKWFENTYPIQLNAANIGSLQKGAAVLISGVKVGRVSNIRMASSGTNVVVSLEIFSDFKIHKDARFVIEQYGFLGDQYVAIIPTENRAPILQPGDEVWVEVPFNLQEAARSAAGFLQRMDDTTKRISDIIDEVREHILNERTLTNLASTAENFRDVSRKAMTSVDDVNALIRSNAPVISQSLSNVSSFSTKLDETGESLQELIQTNKHHVAAALKNLESATITLTNLLSEVQSGKGLAGKLISDEKVAADFSAIAQNLSITTSNLNKLGLWRILWRPREARTGANSGSEILRSPKHEALTP